MRERIPATVELAGAAMALAVLAGIPLGVGLGLGAGLRGGAMDAVVMRLADLFLSVPVVLLAIAVIAAVGPGTGILVAVIGGTQWMAYARTVRGQCLSLKEREYVEAARAVGPRGGGWRSATCSRPCCPRCLPWGR